MSKQLQVADDECQMFHLKYCKAPESNVHILLAMVHRGCVIGWRVLRGIPIETYVPLVVLVELVHAQTQNFENTTVLLGVDMKIEVRILRYQTSALRYRFHKTVACTAIATFVPPMDQSRTWAVVFFSAERREKGENDNLEGLCRMFEL